MQNDHIIIVRFHYEKNDPRFEWRFKYFKEKVLPRILNQTVQDFDIGIRCNPWHEDLFKALSPKIVTFQVRNEGAKYKKVGGKEYFYDFAPWEHVIGLRKYKIQSGLDSDDLIEQGYLALIRETIRNATRFNQKSIHISFQPEIWNVKKKRIEPIRVRYTEKLGSAFMTLYQPDFEDYHFIYERSHCNLGEVAQRSIILPRGYCYASVHEINESTGK